MPWELVDFVVQRQSEPQTPGVFTTVIEFGQVPVGYVWRVEAITAWVGGVGTFVVLAYDQPIGPSTIPIEYGLMAPVGNITQDQGVGEPLIGSYVAICDRSSPLTIQGGDQLSLLFTGFGGGAPCQARVQYQLLIGTPGKNQPILGAPAPAIPVGI